MPSGPVGVPNSVLTFPSSEPPVSLGPGAPNTRSPEPGPGARSPEPGAQSPEPRTPGAQSRDPEPGARSPEPGARSPEPGARSPEPRARSPEPGARSPEPGARSPEPGARSPEPGARSPEPGARSPEPGARRLRAAGAPGPGPAMRRSSSGRKAPPDPEKAGWVRRFCGRGMFREVWRSRFLVLRGDQLLVCEREGKEPGRADEVLDLGQFQCCEEVLKKKNRSKKNHSRFLLLGGAQELLFLAVSPEEKDSWVQQLNAAISRGQNRILDQVTADGAQLSHPTRDRVRAPAGRRRPTRAHLQNPASSSDGMLTLDLIQEKDGVQTGPGPTHLDPREPTRFRAAEAAGKSRSLPREEPDRRTQQNRCASMDPIPSDRAEPAGSEPEPGGSEPGWSEPEPAGSEPGRS
ncbi:pleckstrin homology domain-containing family O member 1-like, partial [Menidia menidia]